MPFDIGLLPSAAMTGLTEDQQGELQRQATQQFLLGTLLSGDPSMGYKGAISLPEQAMAAQTRLLDLQEKERQRQEESNWAAKYNPTKYQETSPEFAGPVSPDVARQQSAIGAARAVGLPTADVDAALRDLTTMRSPRQAQMLAGFQASLPKIGEGGTLTGPGGRYLGTVPQFSPSQGIVYGANVSPTGQVTPYSQEIPGAIATRGKITGTETRAREMNTMRETTLPSGEKQQVFPNAGDSGTGIVTALPTAVTALNEQYKPILADAYAGYQTAKKTNPVIDQLQNAFNDPNFDTGSFTNLRTQLGTALQSIGVTGDRNKQFLTNAISARQGLNALTGESLTEAKGAISNFEIGYYGQRNAQITDPKESTNFNLAVLREANKRKEDFYKFVADPKNAGGDVLQKWEASPQGSKSMFEAPSLRKYLPQREIGDEYGGKYKGQTKHQLPNGKWVIY